MLELVKVGIGVIETGVVTGVGVTIDSIEDSNVEMTVSTGVEVEIGSIGVNTEGIGVRVLVTQSVEEGVSVAASLVLPGIEKGGKTVSGVEVTEGLSVEVVKLDTGSREDVSVGVEGGGMDQENMGELVFTAGAVMFAGDDENADVSAGPEVIFAAGDEDKEVSTGPTVATELSGVDVATVSIVGVGEEESVCPSRDESLACTDVFPTSVLVVKSVESSEAVEDSGGLHQILA